MKYPSKKLIDRTVLPGVDASAPGVLVSDGRGWVRKSWQEVAALLGVGSGTGANGVDVTVNFGSSFTPLAQTVVTGQAWVTASSKIVATLKASSPDDAIEGAVIGFRAVVSDLIAGTGFTLTVFADAEAKGNYTFSCVAG